MARGKNYCTIHGVAYGDECQLCVDDWYNSLTDAERAIIHFHIERRGYLPKPAPKLIAEFRALELMP